MKAYMPDVDERTMAVDHEAGYRAYLVMSWLLVADLALHGVAPAWTDWNGFPVDVAAVLLAGGVTWTWHGARERSISRRRAMLLALAAAAGFVAAVVAVLACMR